VHVDSQPETRSCPPDHTTPRFTTRETMSGPQFIYVMKDLRKIVPPKREILKGIWLS